MPRRNNMAEVNPLDLETYEIADLRKLAAVMKIDAQKTWTKEDYISAINTRRQRQAVSRVVFDENAPIPPGFCRLRLPLTPQGTDTPLTVRVNNFPTTIPRDVLVDVPREVRDLIRTSKEPVTREVMDKDGNKKVQTFEIPSYPFEQVGESMGESGAVKGMTDPKEQRIRETYRDSYGKWPRRTEPEWVEFKKQFIKEFSGTAAKKASDKAKKEDALAE
jgi:hypothetical protein